TTLDEEQPTFRELPAGSNFDFEKARGHPRDAPLDGRARGRGFGRVELDPLVHAGDDASDLAAAQRKLSTHARLSIVLAAAGDGGARFVLLRALADSLPFVVLLLAASDRKLELHPPLLVVEPGGDQGHSFALGRGAELLYL